MRSARLADGSRPILVVEDDESLRRLLFWTLTEEGSAVREAPDGAVALARVREAAPGLILLDMRMPVLDGWEFARPTAAVKAALAGELALRGAGRGSTAQRRGAWASGEQRAALHRRTSASGPRARRPARHRSASECA
jgi:ActR/RegA family two-component response regulator